MVGVWLAGSQGRPIDAFRDLRTARRHSAAAGIGSHAERHGVRERRAAERCLAARGKAVGTLTKQIERQLIFMSRIVYLQMVSWQSFDAWQLGQLPCHSLLTALYNKAAEHPWCSA